MLALIEPQPDRADGAADVVERPQRDGSLRHRPDSRFAAALVVASQSFDDPNVVVMVVVIALVGLSTLMPLSHVLGRRIPPGMATPVA